MKQTQIRLAELAVVILTLTFANAARSQSVPASETGLQEIVVTAERRAENLQDVPISITAITGATLDDLGMKNFIDYATTVPNLVVGAGEGAGGAGSGFGVSSTRSVTIRGVYGNNTTDFYLNDTPIPLSLDPRVIDVDRIEVLRGPQGTLFGAGSMGGTVRMILNDPSLAKTSGKLDAEGFDVNAGGGGYWVNGTVNVPLIKDNVSLRASAFSAFEPGLWTRVWGGPQSPLTPDRPYQPGVPVSMGEKKGVGAEQDTGFLAALLIAPSAVPGLKITPMFMYQRSITNGYPLSDFSPNNFTQIRPLNVPESVSDTWSFGSMTLNYDAGFGHFIGYGTYFYRNAFDDEDCTDTCAVIFFNFPYYVPAPAVNNLITKTWTGEGRFDSSFSGPLQFTLGIFDSLSERTYFQNYVLPGANVASGGTLGTDLVYSQASPNADRQLAEYVDITYSITSAFQVSAGVRDAFLKHTGTYIANGPLNGGFSDSYSEHSEHDLAPRYTAKYEFAPDQLLYASAAKGFRIGGTNSLVPPFCDSALAAAGLQNGQPFNSDSLWSYELGSKNSWLDGHLKSRVSVFDIDWNDIQQTITLSCTYAMTVNGGAARSKGAELELEAAPINHLTLDVAGGYTDAKITEAPPHSLIVEGQPLNGVPKWTASTIGQYSIPTDVRTYFIRGDITYTGYRVSFNDIPATAGGRPLDGYGVVNLRFGANQGPWRAALYANNLFNKSAAISDLLPENVELPGRPRYFIVTPRTVGLELRRDFGSHR